MFYKMIERARDRWYTSPECTGSDLTNYMVQQGHLMTKDNPDNCLPIIGGFVPVKTIFPCIVFVYLFVSELSI